MIKKLTSLLTFTFTSILLASSNDDALTLIQNSGLKNFRELGSQYCRLHIETKEDPNFENNSEKEKSQKDPTTSKKHKKKKITTTQEADLASQLLQDQNLYESIFSNTISENPIIKDLQEGCFDFLSDALVSDMKDFVNFHSNAHPCLTLDDIKEIQTNNPDLDIASLKAPLCNQEQLIIREQSKAIQQKTEAHTDLLRGLISQLGRPDRENEITKKLTNLLDVNIKKPKDDL